ncbi:2-amino-4-hydroxy-6-hydroxymethyldihydropteridine diphosphokinase [Helicobacter sp. 13S00482-2]|uniref:2-amino-4-hydroxy-6- hydroxymethyldihydropteridine diphosphokinase n=1 Tax=Helicobacter sp. 13S00482-2 TaxID=1476200 RepID=UPI000BA67CC8|nr:2-amino-4-hydroxy-6-hydroxymethyldihydropteridine diphosphokinase [Helicobacter sp. 13S00482-2]PAF53062.1 2-amino-4-hydroxy-6-hydroxymethyldihydropteridine diphosphokinase [Helicobacter sp. 13S00482-2]
MRSLIFTNSFPSKRVYATSFGNMVTLGIGGNIGNCLHRFESFYKYLNKNNKIKILDSSPIYMNPPFGFVYQDSFYNATITLSTSLCIVQFFGFVFYLERRFGRLKKREFKNSPRKLDIDIIFFNDLILKRPYLKIPHPKWNERESVLIPLFLQYLIPRGPK